MAERRMFSQTIIDSDAFLDMPVTSQLLYFHLGMRADDDGFVNKPKSIMRTCGCKEDDLKVLVTKKFIIVFDSGIVVIKHWKMHNYLRKDRYKPTKYGKEKAQLQYDENMAYRLLDTTGIPTGNQLATNGIPTGYLGKDRLGKDRIGNTICASDDAKSVCAISNDDINANQSDENAIANDNHFEQIWKMYPNKKGKSLITDATKKELEQITLDEMQRAIDRYQEELNKDDWRKPQYGSTFFNGGYLDYLDANYEEGLHVADGSTKDKSEESERPDYTDGAGMRLAWE